ncbi:MAG: hypothetical protein QXL57_09200, partial [Candidatus Bathyarchaeia archaeon]
SSLVRENLKMLSSKSKSGLSSSIVSKIRLDKFNPKNNIHKKLANLSKKAHQLAEKNDSTLREVEKEIDTLVEKLYSS